MTSLFLSSDVESLAGQLVRELAEQRTPERYFTPQTIVVPNRFVEQWLKLRIARELGVAINVQFRFLEAALWDWLREVDPRPHARPPELLDDTRYALLVLSALVREEDPALAPLQRYCDHQSSDASGLSRMGCRRAWDLARRLAGLVRDYEYHRQGALIEPWLHGEPALAHTDWADRETAQRAVFRHITREPDGQRARLVRTTGRNYKTLPQYAMELLHDVPEYRTPAPRPIRLFGLSTISPLHLRALEVLAPFHEWSVYHVNPLVSRLGERLDLETLSELAELHRGSARPDLLPGTELLHVWGRAGAESLAAMSGFLRRPETRPLRLASRRPRPRPATTLSRVQDLVLGRTPEPARGPQDRSLQIVACPGPQREAETIHNAIVGLAQSDPSLRLTDVAVLATDMERYRPFLTAEFERPPRPLAYNLADYTAARLSVFGQAALGMLDLALESFARSRVFEVFLNPCFLARLGVDARAAGHWLDWAESLGIRHGWDAQEKREQGLFPSALYSWRLGAQRLRLGRYMEVADDGPTAPRWGGVIPFADVESADRENLDAFCLAVEGLLPQLHRLRTFRGPASAWADRLRSLFDRFLAVPEERNEEGPVRDSLVQALDRLRTWDDLGRNRDVNLALVREYVASQLQELGGRRSDLLAGGVTLAALAPQRPLPFRAIFVCGMGADYFPGPSGLSPLDLRAAGRVAGDILPAEHQRFAFLETLLASRERLVVTYDQRDVQRDQERQPAAAIQQLVRFVEKQVLAQGPFRVVSAPLLGTSPDLLREPDAVQDSLTQHRTVERLLAVEEASAGGQVQLGDLGVEIEEQRQRLTRTFPVEPAAPTDPARVPTVPLAWLRDLIRNPAAAALRWRLGARREFEDDLLDHEPLVSQKPVAARLTRRIVDDLVRRSETEPVERLSQAWEADLEQAYADSTQRSRLPEHAFAEADVESLREDIAARLRGPRGLLAFLERQRDKRPCGPVLLGASLAPIGARTRLPALEAPLDRPLAGVPSGRAQVVGAFPVAWESADAFELLHWGEAPQGGLMLDDPHFEPLLFLLAWSVVAADAFATKRHVVLHSARPGGVQTRRVGMQWLNPQRIRGFLGKLASDALDPACAEILPFGAIRDTKWLHFVFEEEEPDAERFFRSLHRKIEQDRARREDFAEQLDAGFRVPADAAQKVRRRIYPFHVMLRKSQ